MIEHFYHAISPRDQMPSIWQQIEIKQRLKQARSFVISGDIFQEALWEKLRPILVWDVTCLQDNFNIKERQTWPGISLNILPGKALGATLYNPDTEWKIETIICFGIVFSLE